MSKNKNLSRKKIKTKPLFTVDQTAQKKDPQAEKTPKPESESESESVSTTESTPAEVPSRASAAAQSETDPKDKGNRSHPPRPSFDLPSRKLRPAISDSSGEKRQSNLFVPPPSKGDDAPSEAQVTFRRKSEKEVPKTADTGITQAILSDVTGSGMLTADISATIEVGTIEIPKKTLLTKIQKHLVVLRKLLVNVYGRLPEKERVTALLATWKLWLVVPLFSEEFKKDTLPPKLPRLAATIVNNAQRYHALSAALGFVIIVALIGASGGEDTPKQTSTPGAAQAAALVGEEATEDKLEEIAPTKLGKYPEFPWKKHLKKLLKATKKSSIYGLYGQSSKAIASSMKGLSSWGPTGYDLLPETKILEVYPSPYKNALSPRMVFLFKDDKLFEIELRYGSSVADKLDNNLFKRFATQSSTKGTEPSGRHFQKHLDNGVSIEQFRTKDKYARVFRSIVFSDQKTINTFGKKDRQRKQALALLERGTNQLGEKKLDSAIKQFQAARKLIPGFGKAYVMEAIAMLRKQEFLRAEFLAHTVLAKTKNNRVKAEANGVKAITHLYRGKTMDAISFWQEAVKTDPANTDMKTYKAELEKGKYSTDRVAKTAARIGCISSSDKKAVNQIQKALLARGNFPDESTYSEALTLAKNDPNFDTSVKKWRNWECN